MTIYFIGLRVRIKDAARRYAHLIGTETRIVGERDYKGHPAWELDLPPDDDGRPLVCLKHHAGQCLEPILPEGQRPCEEDFKHDLDQLLEREGVPA